MLAKFMETGNGVVFAGVCKGGGAGGYGFMNTEFQFCKM